MKIKRFFRQLNIPILALAMLLMLTLVSASISSGMMAKYSTSSEDSDHARVAKFVTVTISESQADFEDVIPNSELDYQVMVTVDGSSEADYLLYADVEIPTFQKDDQQTELFKFTPADGWIEDGEIVGENEIVHQYHLNDKDFIGTVSVFSGPLVVSDYSSSMPESADITVTAKVEQIHNQ